MIESGFHEIMVSGAITTFGECRTPAISVAILVPENKTKGVLQIIHGMNEHKERYYDFMNFLAEKGYGSMIIDNRGHGKSISSPEHLGYINDTGLMILDNEWAIKFVNRTFPDTPHFLLGHSMGSLIARCAVQYFDNHIDGLILSGTPCYTRLSELADIVESELGKKLGRSHRSERIHEWSEAYLNRNFDGLPNSWICSDVSVVNEFNNDPLCNFVYTLSGYEALIGLMKRAYKTEYYQTQNPDIPIHFISGKDDPCMFSEEKFFEAVKFMEDVGYKNTTHKLYVGMRHEVLNEKDKLQVWNDIIEKMNLWTALN